MPELNTFISQRFRPDIVGGKLNKKHKSVFTLNQTDNDDKNTPTLSINAICFGPKNDNVLINLEHVIKKSYAILVFYYEDIHRRWTYVSTNNDEYFLYKKNDNEQYKIKSRCLYIRGCHIDAEDPYWVLLGDFFNFIEIWNGIVLCSPRKQLANESKLYQLNNSLKNSLQDFNSISIGKSYVVKGVNRFKLMKKEKSYIVKSLSGVRSIVVDDHDYETWNLKSINNMPVLFQEKMLGNDLRIHVINNKIFAKRSDFKLNIDYRYDKNFFNLSDVTYLDQELINFCLQVSIQEDNILLGIDFIHTNSGYVVLEANPSPGWSAYHPYDGINDEPFIAELIRVLKGD